MRYVCGVPTHPFVARARCNSDEAVSILNFAKNLI